MSEKKLSRRDFMRMAAVTAAGATLAACAPAAAPTTAPSGGEQPAEKPASVDTGLPIVYWYAWGNLDPAMAKIVELEQFKTAIGGATMEYKGQVTNEAMLTAIAAGTPPDGISNQDYTNLFARGATIAVDSMIATSSVVKKDDFIDAIWESTFIDGKQIGVPGLESYLWWGLNYNTDLAEKAGLDVNAPPKTWDETLEWHKALTTFDDAGNVKTIGLDPYDAMAGECDFAAQSFMGKNWWDDKAKTFDFNNEAFAESLEVMGEFYRIVGPDKFAGMRQAEGQGGWGASYNAQVQSMIIEGYWHPGETQIQQPEVAKFNKSSWAPVPASRKDANIMATGAHMVAIFKDGKNQNGMFKAAEGFLGDEAMDIIFAEVGWVVGRKSYLANVDPNTFPGLDFYLKAADEATEWIIGRRSPIHNFVQTQYQELREKVYRDTMSAADAAAEMQKRAENEWKAQGLG